jgi:hypothetical protein
MCFFSFGEIKIEKSCRHDKAMIRTLGTLILLFLTSDQLHAGFDKQQQGTRPASLAYAGSAMPGNIWSLYHNPAMMNHLGQAVAAYFSPAPFGLSQLSTGGVILNQPIPYGTVGGAVNYSGYELYQEASFSFAFAGSMDREFHYGVVINYHNVSIQNYGSTGVLGIDAGVAFDLSSQVTFGGFISNVNQPKIGEVNPERLPLSFSLGFSYMPAEDLLLLADIQKDIRFDANIRFGIEYLPVEYLAFRVGSSTEPSLFTAGIGIQHEGLGFDYGFINHPDLGGTHTISLSFRLSGN